jgi:hypothetical protein
MNVSIRKTKLTVNVLKQVLNFNLRTSVGFEPIGWCIYQESTKYRSKRIIVFVNPVTNELRKSSFINKIEIKLSHRQVDQHGTYEPVYDLEVYDEIGILIGTYHSKTEDEANVLKTTIEALQQDALVKGQFYL